MVEKQILKKENKIGGLVSKEVFLWFNRIRSILIIER
jgi:hypothetical protein